MSNNPKQYNAQCRKLLITAYEKGEDWLPVVTALGININTARTWIRRHDGGESILQHGRKRYEKLSHFHIEEITAWISENPTLTLEAMKRRLWLEYEINVSISTIGNHLNGKLITLKKIRSISKTMNSVENKEKRKQ
jgi:transposase